MLSHPAHASLDCSECQKWIYDIETCEPKKRFGQMQPRRPNQSTPCSKCPKKSPENWDRIKPTRRTYATLELYRRCRATFGRALTDEEASDPFLQHCFATLDAVFEQVEQARSQNLMTSIMAVTMQK